jgi:kanamycin kinase/aminoglycoside 3'-phosphotransferase-3
MFDLPDKIKNLIGEEKYQLDTVWRSESKVIIFSDKVLKIQTISQESETERSIMAWLQNKLPVPKILGYARDEKRDYLLMTKIPGEMACSPKYLNKPEQLISLLAKALRMFWEVDINNCPFNNNLDEKLQRAKYNVKNNFVDVKNAEKDTFGKNGFKNPEHLLEWLYNNKPKEELVLSHGDFCLPNIFFRNDKITGFIDLARAGMADKWQDIALCYRSLLYNLSEKYRSQTFYSLFEKLRISPERDKIRYYILLDDLL